GIAPARKPVIASGREEPKRVPGARPPGAADPFVGIQDHERPSASLQVVPDGEPSLARPDHDGVEPLYRSLRACVRRMFQLYGHVVLRLVRRVECATRRTYGRAEPRASRGSTNLSFAPHGDFSPRTRSDEVMLVGERAGRGSRGDA